MTRTPPPPAPRPSLPEGGADRDAGVTLVELIVAVGLFTGLGAILLGMALSTSRVTEDVRSLTSVTEQARLATERLTRELRQASAIEAATLPADPSQETAITFWTDFDGDGARDLDAADPEVLTYRWNPATQRLTLTANDPDGTAVTRPVLAAQVSGFRVGLRSSLWQHDADGDGVTTWQELDAAGAPVGDGDGLPSAPELERIDSVTLELTVLDDTRPQTYRTQVDLRNKHQT